MRIAMVLGSSAGGVGAHVRSLVAQLADRGHDLVVCCPEAAEQQFGFGDAGASLVVPVTISDRPGRGDLTTLRVLRHVVNLCDVVHAHGARAGAMTLVARADDPTPVVVTLHNTRPEGRLQGAVFATLERTIALRANAVLGVSQDLVDRARALGAARVGLAVVPSRPPQGPPGHVDLGDAGVRPGRLVALTAARLAPQKGLALLLDTAVALRGLPIDFLVAGDGPQRAELAERVERQSLNVRLLGRRSDVPALLAAADLVISTAVWEGQPVFLQEALHAGAPIVATDVGGTRAVVGDGGILVPAGDAPAMVREVRGLVLDPERRVGLSARALARAAQLPSLRDAADAAEHVYEEVLSQAGRSGHSTPSR
ncbi:MAG: glycosyltransferase family 4 protein [Micrococcales bacterium]|nr:glycosyltransferase family 4 protein [Micrococcales bacterium]